MIGPYAMRMSLTPEWRERLAARFSRVPGLRGIVSAQVERFRSQLGHGLDGDTGVRTDETFEYLQCWERMEDRLSGIPLVEGLMSLDDVQLCELHDLIESEELG